MNENQLFLEIQEHLIKDEKPSEYLNQIYELEEFSEYPFNMLKKLKDTEQSEKYHPEGNVWNHTMMVVDECAKLKKKSANAVALMWASLLHDIGKPQTTKFRRGRLTSYDHDKVGAELSKEFLSFFIKDEDLIKEVSTLVKYHMHILYVVKDLPFGNKKLMLQEADVTEVALLGFADRLGRGNRDFNKEKEDIKMFFKKCQNNRR